MQKDTIKGFIDNRNWEKTPDQIVFKSSLDSKEITYNPNNIQGFGFEGEKYISGIVTIDESPIRDNEITEFYAHRNKVDTVFLQILISGSKGLFYLMDNNLKVHYFIDQNGIYETLVMQKYLKVVNGTSYITTKESFRGQLKLYFQDCSGIQHGIDNISYSRNDLIKLFYEYYKCTSKETLYQAEIEKFKSEFGILGGVSQTKLRLVGSEVFEPLTNTNYPWSKNFMFGIFYNIILPRNQGKWSINTEVIYTTYMASGTSLDSNNVNIYTKYYSSIGSPYIKLNTYLRFKYHLNNISLFMDGGISNGGAISITNLLRIEEHTYSVLKTNDVVALKNAQRWEKGFIGGLGVDFKDFSLEFRTEFADGMSRYRQLSSLVTRYFLIFGYKI